MSVASEAEKFLAMQARKQGAGPSNVGHRGRRSLQVLGESARRLLTAEADPGSSGVVAAGRGLVVRGVRRMVTPRLDLDYEQARVTAPLMLLASVDAALDDRVADVDLMLGRLRGQAAVVGCGRIMVSLAAQAEDPHRFLLDLVAEVRAEADGTREAQVASNLVGDLVLAVHAHGTGLTNVFSAPSSNRYLVGDRSVVSGAMTATTVALSMFAACDERYCGDPETSHASDVRRLIGDLRSRLLREAV